MEFNRKKLINQSRYFNFAPNPNEIESNQSIRIVNCNRNVEFVQSDFIPLKVNFAMKKFF